MALSEIGAQRTHDIQMSPRVTSWRVAGLAASIAVVSILRYSTGPASNLPHELSLRLDHIPILVSAYWYGVTGGLIVAAVSSIAYVNRVFGVAPTLDPARLAEVVVFHLFGVAVGLLASAQRRVMDQYSDGSDHAPRGQYPIARVTRADPADRPAEDTGRSRGRARARIMPPVSIDLRCPGDY